MTDSGNHVKHVAEPQRTHVTDSDSGVFINAEYSESDQDRVMRMRPQDAEILFWQLADWLDYTELLPEWEVGVQEADDEECWKWLHPRAPDPLSARRRALEEVSEWDDPEVYEVYFGDSGRFDSRYHEERWAAWMTDDYQQFMEENA